MSKRGCLSLNRVSVEEPIVNITPLIDVVFVILIAFIVIAPLLELDRVELAMSGGYHPNDRSISVQEKSPIAIHVLRDNTVLVEKRVVNMQELAEYLTLMKQQHPTARPQLFHDKKAHFEIYQSVKNAAEVAGFDQMDVVLQPS